MKARVCIGLALGIVLATATSVQADTPVGGLICSETIWNGTGSPYIVASGSRMTMARDGDVFTGTHLRVLPSRHPGGIYIGYTTDNLNCASGHGGTLQTRTSLHNGGEGIPGAPRQTADPRFMTEFWEHKTAGLCGGVITHLAANSSDEVFAGTYGAGVFRSTDNGETWSKLSYPETYVNALTVNAAGHIFAGGLGALPEHRQRRDMG